MYRVSVLLSGTYACEFNPESSSDIEDLKVLMAEDDPIILVNNIEDLEQLEDFDSENITIV